MKSVTAAVDAAANTNASAHYYKVSNWHTKCMLLGKRK